MAKTKENPILNELMEHYRFGKDDNDMRRLRENGWNDTIKAYFGKLPEDWPYLSMVVDPRIRTTILEKNARLFNGKLRGRLVPRENGDELKAKIQNAVLDYQWDSANHGGSMLEKWVLMDTQTRLFGASFGLVYWRTCEEDGKLTFDGNEFKVLDNRDVFVDYTADHVKNANWVQVREWKTIEQLEEENENAPEPIYKNLEKVRQLLKDASGDRRDTEYESMVKQLRSLDDRHGQDPSFPTFEVVTEYQKGRILKFLPRIALIIQDTPNTYNHGHIPVVQLRYYPVGDDVYGDSEVESVLPIWRGIQAVLCGALDDAMIQSRPPIVVANNSEVRMDTLMYGPNAVMLAGNSVNNIQQMQFSGAAMSNFQVMYGALVNAYNNAMGEMSQGTGVADPFSPDKTATEVRASERQKLTRDQQNQLYLEQSLKDMMQLWVANNKQFIFSDPTKIVLPLRIAGKEILKDLQQLGLADTTMDNDVLSTLRDLIIDNAGDISDSELQLIAQNAKSYKYPVITNPEADYNEYEVKGKLDMDGESGTLYLMPEDFEGVYDYVPSVQSMAVNANEEKKQGREKALQLILGQPVQQQLQLEGERANIKELLVRVLEDNGVADANQYFETIGGGNPGTPQMPGNQAGMPDGGMAVPPTGNVPGGETPVPQPQGLQQMGGFVG